MWKLEVGMENAEVGMGNAEVRKAEVGMGKAEYYDGTESAFARVEHKTQSTSRFEGRILRLAGGEPSLNSEGI